jgi:predicted membrane protein
MDFGDFISAFWPVILILIGLKIIFEKRRADLPSKKEAVKPADFNKSGGNRISESNIFGDVILNVSSDNFSGGSVNNVFGDIKIDLTGIKISQDESELYVSGIFGDITIISNKNYPIKVKASAVIGDLIIRAQKRDGFLLNLDYIDENFEESQHKIYVQCSIVFGSINIY